MEGGSLGKFKVMIIEDSQDCTILLKHILEEMKVFEVMKTFMTGEEGLGCLEHERGADSIPNLIFLDLNLPGEHGLEILQKIKSFSSLHSVPVVIMTASDDRRDFTESYRRGGVFFIHKPFDKELLLQALKQMVITGTLRRKNDQK